MRALLLAAAAVIVFAAPAAAQLRDPFAPAIAPQGTVATTTDTTSTGDTQPIRPAPVTDALANTGADLQGWIVVAVAMIGVGAGALYVFRLYARPL